MKTIIVSFAGLLISAGLLAAESLTLETFLTNCGVYQSTNAGGATVLTIATNSVWLNGSDASHGSSAGVTTWSPGKNWFVYIARDLRVWAYDGNRGLSLVKANTQSAESVSIEYLKERPPEAVLKRLPNAVKKRLPKS